MAQEDPRLGPAWGRDPDLFDSCRLESSGPWPHREPLPLHATNMNRLVTTLALLGSTAGLSAAQQPSIYVDIGSTSGGAGTPASTFGAAASTGGFWNDLDLDFVAAAGHSDTEPGLVSSMITHSDAIRDLLTK